MNNNIGSNTNENDRRIAILIDSENVSYKYIKYILDEVSSNGIATYKRIYGDWTKNSSWKDVLLENAIQPIQQFSNTKGKNSSDSALIIDAMDILYSGNVDGFCIVSSDSDFTRLATRIRESGKYVMGIGENKTPSSFRSACNTFKILEVIAQEDEDMVNNESAITKTVKIKKAVLGIITENDNKGRATGIGEVGSKLVEKYSDFDVRNYGFSKLSTFLESLNAFQIYSDGKGTYISEAKEDDDINMIEKKIFIILRSNNGKLDNMSALRRELEHRIPDFDIKRYGYSKFSNFIKSFKNLHVEGNVVTIYEDE